jgi:hypothetical protein
MINKSLIIGPIRVYIPNCKTASEFLNRMIMQFTKYSKVYAITLVSNFVNMRYDDSSASMISSITKLNKKLW